MKRRPRRPVQLPRRRLSWRAAALAAAVAGVIALAVALADGLPR